MNTMKIRGKYEEDSNFILVYAEDNALYTIPKNRPAGWARIKIGDSGSYGWKLTADRYEAWKAACTKEGVFELPLY